MATAKKKPKSVALSAATPETPLVRMGWNPVSPWHGLTATEVALLANMRLAGVVTMARHFQTHSQRGETVQARAAARYMSDELKHLAQLTRHLESLLTQAAKDVLCEANENRTVSVNGEEYLSYVEAVFLLCWEAYAGAYQYGYLMSAATEISEWILRHVGQVNFFNLKNALICEDRRLRAVQNKNTTTLPPLTDSQQEVFDFIREHGPVSGKQICTGLGISSESTLTRHFIGPLKLHGVKNRRGSGYYLDK